jgi:hypothetical protein
MSLLGAILQIAALEPEVWKERNHPEEPVLQPCELGNATTSAHTFAELPSDVALELARFFDATPAMSDRGGLFNSTDVVDGNVPQRRFLRAYHAAITGSFGMSEAEGLPLARERLLCGEAQNRLAKR